MALTETWLQGNMTDYIHLGEVCPAGFTCLHVPRVGRMVGGIAVIHRTEPKTNLLTGPSFNSFENMEVEITGKCDRTLKLHVIYRPKPHYDFFEEFLDYIEGIVMDDRLDIVGDFNFDWLANESTNSNVRKMKDMLLSFNLIQHVLKPTHTSGYVLDYIISPSSGKLVIPDTIEVSELISDHAAIICSINCSKPNTIRKEITYRQLKKITWTILSRM